MTDNARADAEFYLRWTSSDARHTDRYFLNAFDFDRDALPAGLAEGLLAAGPDVALEYVAPAGELVTDASPGAPVDLPRHDLDRLFAARRLPGPLRGRFYPRGWLAGSAAVNDIPRTDMRPFRVSALTSERLLVDLNHPLAGYVLTVGGSIHAFPAEGERRDGSRNDIVADMARHGAGMQCRPAQGTVDFIQPTAFERDDTSADSVFYRTPRLVQHLDATAREIINELYRVRLHPAPGFWT